MATTTTTIQGGIDMVECVMAWILLIVGFLEGSGQLLIASGAFAVACNVYRLVDVLKDRNEGE